jgi:serine protease Do
MMAFMHQSFKLMKAAHRLWVFAAVVFCLFYPRVSSAQPSRVVRLQEQMALVIKRVSPACVRMWGFDTLLQQRTSGQFSGVVTKGGYILTAAHVTTPGITYQVMFPDGRVGIATALGKIEFADDKTRPDVALMKLVGKSDWPYAEMGNSAGLRAFQPCLSIAYPESLNQTQPTVRFGFVAEPLVTRGFIKSTCLMEPGDSGGPLFNANGEIIGLHSAIEVPEADNYDVPVNLYKKYWSALNAALVYHTLPEATSEMNEFSGKAQSAGIPALQNMASFAGAGNRYQKDAVSISSLINGKQQKIAGTPIALRGTLLEKTLGSSIIVSKSSMVGDTDIIIAGHKATVIRRDEKTDLVMLRIQASLPAGIELKDLIKAASKNMSEGAFLISPRVDTAAVIGILGGKPVSLPKISSAGFLGATAAHGSQPAKLFFIRPGSPATANDMRVADIVTHVGGTAISNAAALLIAMSGYWPGDTVIIKLKRGSEELVKSVVLTYPPEMKHNHPAEYFAGGKSRRRDGFAGVYVNDAVLKADQCGGPVFDIDGNLCGINIARFSRACSLFLGADEILRFVNYNAKRM